MQKAAFAKPEIESIDLERYQVFSQVEILSLLRTVLAQRVLVTLYFNRGEEFLLTTLLSVNPEFAELVFDAGPDKALNARLLASQRITAVAFIDSVKMQFSATRAENTEFERTPAFRLRLPDSVLRLQRRNYFRVPTPIARPLRCAVALPETPGKSVELVVVEMSCGGMSVTMEPGKLAVEPGTRVEQCSMDLPEIGTLQCTLVVRHISDASKNALRRHRLGCEFVDLPGPMAALLQRFVNKVERERRSRQ
jgi:c-di-GMP-binding flagellar brake protein YcgR